MRLLLINPNTTTAVTQLIEDAARFAAPPHATLSFVTAQRGVPYISTRTEALIGGLEVMNILAEQSVDHDAAIIAAFGDPGLGAAREMFPIPVVGLAEAGMLSACMLGRRFSIVSFAAALEPWYQECVEWHRMESRCASIRTLDNRFKDIGDVQNEREVLLVELARKAVEEDGADVIVLAGAPLSGLARRVRDQIPVPVVDCVAAAVGQALALIGIYPIRPSRGAFARPAAKPSKGISPALANWIAGNA
jgi:allantoin racemase